MSDKPGQKGEGQDNASNGRKPTGGQAVDQSRRENGDRASRRQADSHQPNQDGNARGEGGGRKRRRGRGGKGRNDSSSRSGGGDAPGGKSARDAHGTTRTAPPPGGAASDRERDSQNQNRRHQQNPRPNQQSEHRAPQGGRPQQHGQSQRSGPGPGKSGKDRGTKPVKGKGRAPQKAAPDKTLRPARDIRDDAQRYLDKPIAEAPHRAQRYGIVFFETLQAAKADVANLSSKLAEVDQLNIVIRAEANMDDPELAALGKVKVFAGAAWTLIHERRKADGWYDAPR